MKPYRPVTKIVPKENINIPQKITSLVCLSIGVLLWFKIMLL